MPKNITATCILLLTICMFVAEGSYAASTSDLGFKGIGGRIGFVKPEADFKTTVEIGLVTDWGTVARNLFIESAVTYWKSSYDVKLAAHTWGFYDADFAVKAGLKYHFLDREWQPFAGGGLGLHFYSTAAEAPSEYHGGYPYKDETQWGFYLVGGIEHQFTEDLKGSVEVQWDAADINQTALQLNLIYLIGK
jgi:hypothetical protein